MGHLFRALNLAHRLEEKGKPYVVLANRDKAALDILRENKISPIIVDLSDAVTDWEGRLIRERGITRWLNDRLDTSRETAEHVKAAGIPLYTIDDMGPGAALADGNFASLIFEDTGSIPGRQVYAGCRYLILNPEIATYRRMRGRLERILVTLGGSDTYGVTLGVIRYFKKLRRERGFDQKLTILLGPGSVIRGEAKEAVRGTDFEIVCGVPSLMRFFQGFDAAVTGGGVTALEAAASGLPCMVIANEPHEEQIGRYLEQNGCGVFAGYYKEMAPERFAQISGGDLPAMSRRGMETVDLDGAERVCRVLYGKEWI